MQAPPPTPNSGYLSLSSSPPTDRNQYIPNSLPTLAMILNGEVATMDHINNALTEHLNNDRVLERFQSLDIGESDEENNEKANPHHRSRPTSNDKKEPKSPQTPSTEQSTPTENHHPIIDDGVRAVPAKHRRSYSTNDVGTPAARPLSIPTRAVEVARVLQRSDEEMRRARGFRR